jgi:hypothetical protein
MGVVARISCVAFVVVAVAVASIDIEPCKPFRVVEVILLQLMGLGRKLLRRDIPVCCISTGETDMVSETPTSRG